MIVLILAAGYGTRLYPLTKEIPKALLPVRGKPILRYLVERCEPLQPRELVLVANHRYAEKFHSWFLSEKQSIPWTVLDDGSTSEENRLGSIGDLVFAIRNRSIQDDILVLGADNLFEDDLNGFFAFAKEKAPGVTLGAYQLPSLWLASRYGVLTVGPDNRIHRLEEKPKNPRVSLVSTAIYFFPASQLRWVLQYPGSTDTLGAFLSWLIPQESVFAFSFKRLWFDIGDRMSYQNAQELFSQ